MNLIGHENRKRFIEKYDVTPISHQKILDGQYKEGIAGLLTDRYYCFSYKLKGDENDEIGTFNCGYSIAEDLLKLTNQEKIPLFNPLKIGDVSEQAVKDNTKIQKNKKKYDSLALQLSNAINLIILCYDGTISGTLAEIKSNIDKYYYSRPFDYKVKSVNTIINKLFKQKLTKKVYTITKNQEIKNFDFELLSETINKYETNNYFE